VNPEAQIIKSTTTVGWPQSAKIQVGCRAKTPASAQPALLKEKIPYSQSN